MDISYDLRTRTTLVCGALALAIAVSALLGTKERKARILFAAFAADVGLWYLSQSFFGLYQQPVLARLRVVLAIFMPVFAVNLFEAMVPAESGTRRRMRTGRWSLLAAAPMMVLALSPALHSTWVRVVIFLYAVGFVAAGLYELGQRGLHSRSRATQRRVRFLVVTGALAGLLSVADFVWVIGYAPEYHPPPVGIVLSVVFLFMLAQALRHQRLLDLYEMLGRLLVATAMAFIIAFVFYVAVTVVGQFNTMWLNAIMVAIVVLVLFNPLREWVEEQIQRLVFRERGRLEAALSRARRRLAHTLELGELATVVSGALEQSRSVTHAALYLLHEDGSTFERLAKVGEGAPERLEVATASALVEQLRIGPVVLEQLAREAREGSTPPGRVSAEAVLAAAEVLGQLRHQAVVLPVRAERGAVVGLLVVADERIGDAFSPEDVGLLETLAAQIGVVIDNSRHYEKMKERDRLAVLGQLAAGLAHEIRNPLGAIKGAAQLLAEPAPDAPALDDSSNEFVGIILEEVDRLDEVVSSVLDLSRRNTEPVAPIDVNGVVLRTLQVLRAEWDAAELRIATQLDDALPASAIAPTELRQVMMNLLRNAKQALGQGGHIVVATRQAVRGGTPCVAIGVQDDGPGIAAAALDKIFLPFFTTKDDGTGLGLAICQRIVRNAGGRIEVRSRPGDGTTFEVLLPVARSSRPGDRSSIASGVPGS